MDFFEWCWFGLILVGWFGYFLVWFVFDDVVVVVWLGISEFWFSG